MRLLTLAGAFLAVAACAADREPATAAVDVDERTSPAAAAVVAACEQGLQALGAVAPELPALAENSFDAKARVAITVDPNGSVRDARLVSLEATPVGHANREPNGYADATVAAVGQWRYPPRATACRMEVSVHIEMPN